MNHPTIYEINTRVWIKNFGADAKLYSITDEFIHQLREWGINYLWLMGVWKNNPEAVSEYCFEPDLVNSYNKALPDWKKSDVIGSPYSIDSYEVNPILGSEEDLVKLKERLNKAQIKLILDFVPNHYSSRSKLLKSNPEIFLPADEALYKSDKLTFFKSAFDENQFFTHGRDPLFPPWQDTAQVNYFSERAREFQINTLLKLSKLCDGVRCDMAMLQLNNTFQNTWIGVLRKYGVTKPETEFWRQAIKSVKSKEKDFLFLAEVYWDLEWDLQQLGFDCTYDKRLTDRLASTNVRGIKDHLKADTEFQNKSIRFIENHDEDRAISKLGKEKSLAAATIISTLQGMRFYYDGQFQGRKTKLPVQLGRAPSEKNDDKVNDYYYRLLAITKSEVFRKGTWKLLSASPVSESDSTFEEILAWEWEKGTAKKIVVINYSAQTARCRLKLDLKSESDDIVLIDELNKVNYSRSVSDISEKGLFIELKSYSSHIFST